ncbi:hypothetical protein JMJ77_0000337 [Colletotrichum scovillei]|uniref:Uncharacterized protein n=1 Tax=Colletotrichum scovillei TaxID=1209932 RepID=A0A9P7RB12_9PEZI|nr:hypothetical protein JMJ77_0000337 [Colletotrichum scovillei]KAG7071544.1 hypothetical protein JMJ76_0004415 [Colletotrichum scovillei]KAG7079824.1 hypothetical protein JMJ78_0006928 [Colletotrichum scovillei]
MEVTLEVIIAIIALVVGSSPTCLVLWNCYIRRRQRMEQASTGHHLEDKDSHCLRDRNEEGP